MDVVLPANRSDEEGLAFLRQNSAWLLAQVDRAQRMRSVRRPVSLVAGQIPFRGQATPVRLLETQSRARGNTVQLEDGVIVVRRGEGSTTAVGRSLESWLRSEARRAIRDHLSPVCQRLNAEPKRVYVMAQRTKWGNCSSRQNLSFNWRLVLAPDFVLRYLVTHEAVHLIVPDHSARFWLTVQSHCPDAERARQWLSANGRNLNVDFSQF